MDEDAAPALTAAARTLYDHAPEEFTGTRTDLVRAARADGDRGLATSIGALRKPSVAAWAVNRLTRDRPDVVLGVLELGARMAEAQRALAGADLRELGREQHRVLADVRRCVAEVGDAAGRRLSDAVVTQVESTLRAAMADADAARAVRSGLLVVDLASTGFDPVDTTGAVAVPDAPPLLDAPATAAPAAAAPAAVRTPPAREPSAKARAEKKRPAKERAEKERSDETDAAAEKERPTERAEKERARKERAEEARRAARLAEAREALADAEGAAERAHRAVDAAETDVSTTEARERELAAEVEELTARLARAQEDHAQARVAHRRARAERERARREASAADGRVGRARGRVPDPGA